MLEASGAELVVSTSVMARIVGITEVHLGRLHKSGDLPPPLSRGRWDVIRTVQAFIAYRSGEHAPVADGSEKSEELLLIAERRRLTGEQADRLARTNAREAGNLVEVGATEARMINQVIALRRGLVGVGAAVRRKLGLERAAETLITETIGKAVERFVRSVDGGEPDDSGDAGSGDRDQGVD